jgi:hypothetical protein
MLTEEVPKTHWETPEMWRKYVERQLYELGTLVKGQIPIQADRIADVVEQIEALRKELKAVHEKLDKVGDYVKANVPKKNGGAT